MYFILSSSFSSFALNAIKLFNKLLNCIKASQPASRVCYVLNKRDSNVLNTLRTGLGFDLVETIH